LCAGTLSAGKADGKGGGSGCNLQLVPVTLQLYSILPRPLSGRAQAWGSSLNFKQSSETLAQGFFDAPGRASYKACIYL
jgi:hypothetical protein